MVTSNAFQDDILCDAGRFEAQFSYNGEPIFIVEPNPPSFPLPPVGLTATHTTIAGAVRDARISAAGGTRPWILVCPSFNHTVGSRLVLDFPMSGLIGVEGAGVTIVESSRMHPGSELITVSNDVRVEGFTFRGNPLASAPYSLFGALRVQALNAQDPYEQIIRQNVFEDFRSYRTTISLGQSEHQLILFENNIVRQNTIYIDAATGFGQDHIIQLQRMNGGSEMANNVVRDNLFQGAPAPGEPRSAVLFFLSGGSDMAYVTNNILAFNVLRDGVVSNSGSAFIDVGTSIGENFPGMIPSITSGSGQKVTHNVSFGNTSSSGSSGVLDYVDLAVDNVDFDPVFVGGGSSLSTGSPAVDSGNPDARYDDTDGSRNDRGAYGGPGGDW